MKQLEVLGIRAEIRFLLKRTDDLLQRVENIATAQEALLTRAEAVMQGDEELLKHRKQQAEQDLRGVNQDSQRCASQDLKKCCQDKKCETKTH